MLYCRKWTLSWSWLRRSVPPLVLAWSMTGFVVPRIVTYAQCLKSRAREMARLPTSRMACQPKWLFPNHLFLTFKWLGIKMSDLLCLCLWKRMIWKRQKEAMTGCQGDVHRIWGHFTFVGPYEPELIITWEFSLTERHTLLAIETKHGVAYLFTKKKCFI